MSKFRDAVGDALFLIGLCIFGLAGVVVPASVDFQSFVILNIIGLELAVSGVWFKLRDKE
jgi:hypothetical protein